MVLKLLLILRNGAQTIFERREQPGMWRNWLIGGLGTWMIIASFTMDGNIVNELVTGIAVAILGFWTAMQGS